MLFWSSAGLNIAVRNVQTCLPPGTCTPTCLSLAGVRRVLHESGNPSHPGLQPLGATGQVCGLLSLMTNVLRPWSVQMKQP